VVVIEMFAKSISPFWIFRTKAKTP